MTQTLEAVFDGDVLWPDEPLRLAPNTRVRLVVETVAPAKEAQSFRRWLTLSIWMAPPIGRKTWPMLDEKARLFRDGLFRAWLS